eukprot:33539-Chlamydomonas_euryale.AAC.2
MALRRPACRLPVPRGCCRFSSQGPGQGEGERGEGAGSRGWKGQEGWDVRRHHQTVSLVPPACNSGSGLAWTDWCEMSCGCFTRAGVQNGRMFGAGGRP